VPQQQAAQPFVYVPTTLMYDSRPPAAAVDQSGKRWMSESSNPPSVATVSDVPGNAQFKHLQSWETGRMMPAPSTMSSAPSAAATDAPYQTYSVEQRPGNFLPYTAVSQVEERNQYGAAYDATYRQGGSSDMEGFAMMPTEYYDNRSNVNVGGNVDESEPATVAGLEMNGAVRGASSSALRQPASAPGTSKKTVTFHENIATEYAIQQWYGSTSSDSSFVTLSPPEMSGGYDSVMFPGPVYSYGSSVPR